MTDPTQPTPGEQPASNPPPPWANEPPPPPWAGQPYTGYTPPGTPKPRPWVARHKVLTGLGVVAVFGVIAAAAGIGATSGGDGRELKASASATQDTTKGTALDPNYTPSSAPPAAEVTETEDPAEGVGDEPTPVGTKVSVGDDDGTIDADVTVVSAKTYRSGRGALADAPEHGRYLVVEVLVTVKAGTLSYNPFDWSYQHPDGTTYSYGQGNAIFAGFEPRFDSGDLKAGQKTRGLITFDVKYAKGGIIQYSPGQSTIASWLV